MINWRPRMCVSARELAINCHYLLVLVCALVRATSLRFLLVFDILAVVCCCCCCCCFSVCFCSLRFWGESGRIAKWGGGAVGQQKHNGGDFIINF